MLRSNGRHTVAACSAAMLVMVALLIGGCSAPTKIDDSVLVTLASPTPPVLQVGRTALVEATVGNTQGQFWEGQIIRFTLTPTDGGRFTQETVTSGADGSAVTTFVAEKVGNYTITAKVEGLSAGISGTDVASTQVTIEAEDAGTDPTGQMVLTISPTVLPADGRSQTTVTAAVSDQAGNLVPDSTLVKFTCGERFADKDSNGIFTLAIDSLIYDIDGDREWDQIGTIETLVPTVNGFASAIYTAGQTAVSVWIKATVDDPALFSSADRSITLTSTDSIHTINMTPGWQRIQVKGSGGIEWVKIVATGYNMRGDRVGDHIPIEFDIVAGPGGGEDLNGAQGSVVVETDQFGDAPITLNSGSISGTVRIRARSGSAISNATQVAITAGPPAWVSVGAVDCNMPSWDRVNVTNPCFALVADDWGNEVADSTMVHFTVSEGLIEGSEHTQVSFTFRGVANSWWHSGNPRVNGRVMLTASSAGGAVADTSMFFSSGLADTIIFNEFPSRLDAEAGVKARILITVLDVNGNFMDSDTPVDADAKYGIVTSDLLTDGCHSSSAKLNYFAPTLNRDHAYSIPDNGIGAYEEITVGVSGFAGAEETRICTLLTSEAFKQNSRMDILTSIDYNESVAVEVSIKDRNLNPLGGHLIRLSAGVGSFVNNDRYTDKFGVAKGFTYVAPPFDSSITKTVVTATDLDPGYGGIAISTKVAFQELQGP